MIVIKIFRFHFDMLYTLTNAELKTRFKRTWLGFIWTLLNPLIQLTTIGFIFYFLTKPSTNNYFFYLITGLLPYNFFSQTLNQTSAVILQKRQLLTKPNLNKEILPAAIVGANLISFLINLCLVIILAFIIKLPLNLNNLFLIIPTIIWLIGINLGLSLLISACTVWIRDLIYITRVITTILLYLSPILYQINIAPPIIKKLFYINPLTSIIILLNASLNLKSPLPISLLFSILIISLLIIILGFYVFKKLKPYFIDQL